CANGRWVGLDSW
nr:immunoglobulin heavy chain junction region [Macaca mulatta]MOV35954.1 immunoglobulin heavy chain junction region [Macaca mulatta]MOV36632.1 immunoglobulin heavy chain junction region [Macaca mulatta]